MISALFSALNARSVSAVLLAVGVVVAYVSRGWDRPRGDRGRGPPARPRIPVETRGFRFPAPDAYPLDQPGSSRVRT